MPTQKEFAMPYLGRRIAVARRKSGLTQKQLAAGLGFSDRQTLQAIEANQRRVSEEELLRVVEVTNEPLDFFLDPFSLAGEGEFSFRGYQTAVGDLAAFEEKVSPWIAAWWCLGEQRGEPLSVLRSRLPLNLRSTLQEAEAAGEALAREWNLGKVPSEKLLAVAEQHLGLLVLLVDMPEGISSTACRLPAGDSVLLPREIPAPERITGLALSIFHLLTWDAMPPARVVQATVGYKDKRIERLAGAFVRGLLIPSYEVRGGFACPPESVEFNDWLLGVASHFGVSVEVVMSRYLALGLYSEFDSRLDLTKLERPAIGHVPPPFSRPFMGRIGWAVGRGEMSVKAAASLLGSTPDDIANLFTGHGLEVPFPQ